MKIPFDTFEDSVKKLFRLEGNKCAEEDAVQASVVFQMSEITNIVGTILSIVFVLLLPGFAVSYVLFPKKDEIDWIERLTLSFGFSMAIIPFTLFSLNLIFSIKIDTLNTLLVSSTVMLISYIGYMERKTKLISRRVFRK